MMPGFLVLAPARVESFLASCTKLEETCLEAVRPKGFIGSVNVVTPGRLADRGVGVQEEPAVGLDSWKLHRLDWPLV